MDRREFLRRIVTIGVMGAVGASGVYALAQKILSDQRTNPPVNNSSSLNSDPATETVTVLTTVEAPDGVGSSSASGPATNVTTTTTSGQLPPSGYILLAPLSAVTGKTYAYFTHPTGGSSILVNYSGTWRAFSAVCPHAGCTIDYASSELYCPCHNAYFDATDGHVLRGPPPSGLIEYGVQIINNDIYVSSARIN